jgi:hypothetical protein
MGNHNSGVIANILQIGNLVQSNTEWQNELFVTDLRQARIAFWKPSLSVLNN